MLMVLIAGGGESKASSNGVDGDSDVCGGGG